MNRLRPPSMVSQMLTADRTALGLAQAVAVAQRSAFDTLICLGYGTQC